MAKNFQIKSVTRDTTLVLELYGDFDGMSAFELARFLKERCQEFEQIEICTQELERIVYFGIEIWQKELCSRSDLHQKILFTGENSYYFLLSEGNSPLNLSDESRTTGKDSLGGVSDIF